MGRNVLREVLRHSPDRIVTVFSAKSAESESEAAELLSEFVKARVAVELLPSGRELSALVGSESHQLFVALLRPRVAIELKHFLTEMELKERSIIVAMDGVTDPQNIGSILRASECFGVDAVIWSRNRGPEITPVVAKVSVGASELVPTIQVGNLMEALRKIKESGYWLVVADSGENSVALDSFEFPQKTLMVLGAEGQGVKELVKKNADFSVRIPMFGKIDSLNVSQASAVFLYAARRSNNAS